MASDELRAAWSRKPGPPRGRRSGVYGGFAPIQGRGDLASPRMQCRLGQQHEEMARQRELAASQVAREPQDGAAALAQESAVEARPGPSGPKAPETAPR